MYPRRAVAVVHAAPPLLARLLASCVLVLLLTGLLQPLGAHVKMRGREHYHRPHEPPRVVHKERRVVVRARFHRGRPDVEYALGLLRTPYRQDIKYVNFSRFLHVSFRCCALFPAMCVCGSRTQHKFRASSPGIAARAQNIDRLTARIPRRRRQRMFAGVNVVRHERRRIVRYFFASSPGGSHPAITTGFGNHGAVAVHHRGIMHGWAGRSTGAGKTLFC